MMLLNSKSDLRIYVTVTYGLVLLVLGVNAWRPFEIVISNHTVESFSPKIRINASLSDSGVFDLHVEFLNKVQSLYMHTDIYFESDYGKYDMELVNRTIDMCKFFKNKRYEPIIQVVFKLLAGYLNHWTKRCPMNKGVYYLESMKLNVENLPPIFPEKRGVYDAIVLDKLEQLYRVKVYFEIPLEQGGGVYSDLSRQENFIRKDPYP